MRCDQRRNALGVLPPPLWGRVGEGGGARLGTSVPHLGTSTPNPSPQGGGEQTSACGAIVRRFHQNMR
jgi:hypothetical protein